MSLVTSHPHALPHRSPFCCCVPTAPPLLPRTRVLKLRKRTQFKLGRLGTQAPLNHTQFNLGHLDALEEARASLKEAGLDGVLLGGNYVSGVALGKVVEFGFGEFADSIAESLGKDQGRAAGALN